MEHYIFLEKQSDDDVTIVKQIFKATFTDFCYQPILTFNISQTDTYKTNVDEALYLQSIWHSNITTISQETSIVLWCIMNIMFYKYSLK